MVNIEINGAMYEAEPDQTVLEVAKKNSIIIPTLCHLDTLPEYGGCRLCMVERMGDGWSQVTTACTLPVKEGMKVQTDSEKVRKSRKMTIELLLARCPDEEVLQNLAEEYGVGELRFKKNDDNCILCGLCVRMCQRMGIQAIDFQGRGMEKELGTPYMEKSDVCITCGACAYICPTTRFTQTKVERVSGNKPIPVMSEFEHGMGTRNAIYIPFPQAVPKIPVIDKNICIYYQTGECKTCEEVCEAGAIKYDQEEEVLDVDIGSIVIAAGTDVFDPARSPGYGYEQYKNVITSLEFERMLSASGPTGGHIMRPYDHKDPKKIAFIQCVGSRDCNTNPYCSSVCCTYAVKESIIAQEHSPGLEAHIYAMDIRTFGKGFEEYKERAVNEYGVKIFKNSRVPYVEELEDGSLVIKRVEEGKLVEEEYDMVILSVGLEPSKDFKELAAKLGVDLNDYGFCRTSTFNPLSTSKPGIFVSGVSSSPKDIPETVAQSSGAAAMASYSISDQRNTMVRDKDYPPELDVYGMRPRIGVFVCHCGTNISGTVDVKAVAEYARSLPDVAYATDNVYTCSQDTQELIKDLIEEHNLNRIVIASCSPRTHEPLFQDTIREAGLNKYLFEMANIRDQCSWVHQKEPEKATQKSMDLVKMNVAKARLLEPLDQPTIDITKELVVIGGGLSGMTAALGSASNGIKTHLIEKGSELGGNLKDIHYLLGSDKEPQEALKEIIAQVEKESLIEVHMNNTVKEVNGFVGNFETTLADDTLISNGAIIVATGAKEYKPKEYMYGQDEKVVTQKELEASIAGGKVPEGTVVMIQCVGSRNDENPQCSRICCTTAVKNALKIKELNPEAQIYVLNKDIRTYSFNEDYYREAAEKGVVFIRYDDEKNPEVTNDGGLTVRVDDPILGETLELKPDTLVLSAATIPPESNGVLAPILKVPQSKDGFFLEAHVKMRPVDFATEGIYLCGLAQWPKFIDESISQANGAVARAMTVLSKDKMKAVGVISQVDETTCSGCALCMEQCPYNAIEMLDLVLTANEIDALTDRRVSVAHVRPALCKGCGSCAAVCPSGAIEQKGYMNEQIYAMIYGMVKEDRDESKLKQKEATSG